MKSRIKRLVTEKLSLSGDVFTVVMLGGSIGSKSIRTLSQLKGEDVMDPKVYVDIDQAKAAKKRMNKILSPGEKKYYGLKYVVARVKDGKYTGK